VPVIAARDERDPLSRRGGGLSDRPPRSDVRVVVQIAGGRDDSNWDLWFRPASHEVRGDQHRPIHGKDGGRRIVRAVAHRHNGYAGITDRVPNGECDLAVDRDSHRDRATPLHQIARNRGRVDDRHCTFDVDIVRSKHDGDIRLRGDEPPAELLHPRGGRVREGWPIFWLGFRDCDRSVRCDTRKHQRHSREYARLNLNHPSGR